MYTEALIPANEVCTHYQVELSFIYALQESGLIETNLVDEELFLPKDQLKPLEKFVRLHYEMNINLEGLETISYLLLRINNMHQQLQNLNKQLRLYEID